MQFQLRYITQHYTTLITLHCSTTTTTSTTATTTTTTLPYTTLHCPTLITPHHNYNYTTLTTLHYNYNSTNYTATTTPLHYNYNYNCTTPHYIQQLRWGDHCNHCNHSKKHNSNHLSVHHLSVHQWVRSAIRDSQEPTSPTGFLWFPILETSATALRGTTGIRFTQTLILIYKYI